MNETRTQSKIINDLCQINRLVAYLSKLLAGGRFEVGHNIITNPKIPPKIKNVHCIFNEIFKKIENRKIGKSKFSSDFFLKNIGTDMVVLITF